MQDKVYYLTNQKFDMKLKQDGIVSLKNRQSEVEVEFIESQLSFGQIHLVYREENGDWKSFKSEEVKPDQIQHHLNEHVLTYVIDLLEVKLHFLLNRQDFIYQIELMNKGNKIIEIGDLSIPFPMNSEFEWGGDANKRVLKHSFISGHGSYIFWERCNGEAPYLLMTPLNESKFEYFNLFESDKKKHRKIYEAFIYSKNEGEVAANKGCNWRQSNTSTLLKPEEHLTQSFKFQWKSNYEEIRNQLVKEGLLDIQVIPGMTVPMDLEVKFSIRANVEINDIVAEHTNKTQVKKLKQFENYTIYSVKFSQLGENFLEITFDQNKKMLLEFFVTESIETLIKKRASFIVNHQIKDISKWYDGLLAEWNMDNQNLLSPDHYDRIKGWRIYEVTCDDPGLSKPAYLSSKLVEFPNQDEVNALDYYIERFVWGGLQRTEEEEFSYGIYGIPDWKVNRDSSSEDTDGQLHIWRIYDYPHIFLMYWNLYQVRKFYSHITTTHKALEYLKRAYQTAVAMFTIPWELEEWSAFKTGLYNELVIPDIVAELYRVGMREQGKRLEKLWVKKVKHFVLEKSDLFGSEYPFDTTGFESTYAFADYAMKQLVDVVEDDDKKEQTFTSDKVLRFMDLQRRSNIACRGYLEPAYYLLGSDYRTESCYYSLSYMSQMGTNGILTYALDYLNEEGEDLIRLGYAALLSSWALMNTGTEESNYGYWYSGIENDGGAGGGFEAAPYGETWLNQDYTRGSWYYSCEIDLGFCGALRAMATVVIHDSIFGAFCYGGEIVSDKFDDAIYLKDGIRRKVYYVREKNTLKVEVKAANICDDVPVMIGHDLKTIQCTVETMAGSLVTYVSVSGLHNGIYKVTYDQVVMNVQVNEGMLDIECLNLQDGRHLLLIEKVGV